MPTVIHELADAFLRRKQALAERGQAKTKLAGSDYFMPKSAKEDLNNRLSVFEQGGLPELLKQAGKEMYDNPIVNTAIGFTPGVGDVQAAGETVAALQRGAPWQETAGYAVGMLPFVPALRTTWHGSPHGFTKFDMSKIGTGEGAQAYGHGLYLADAPETAKSYQQSTSGGASKAVNASYSQDPELWVAGQLHSGIPKQDIAEGLQTLGYKGNANKLIEQGANRLNAELNAGYLYKVELPDEQIAKMLDWDKPIGQQSKEAQAAIQATKQYLPQNAMDDLGGDLSLLYGKDVTPNQFLNTWESLTGTTGSGEKALLEQGIPGIQYLDQASRGAGEGTRNYVVFSDEIPKILERNGTSVFEFPKE